MMVNERQPKRYRLFVTEVLIPILCRLGNKDLNHAIDVLRRLAVDLTPAAPSLSEDSTTRRITISAAWNEFLLDELMRFNKDGNNAVGSVAEAVVKVHGVMNTWNQGIPKRYFFRGEHNFSWDARPRAGRGMANLPQPAKRATSYELDLVTDFQSCFVTEGGYDSDFMPARIPAKDSAEWWVLAQHYDEKGGTRLVDITSSIFCGLYFGCANWDGTVDSSVDGALYLFPNSDLQSWPMKRSHTLGNFFDVNDHLEVVRLVESSNRNDRLIAQDGYFLWQPNFTAELNVSKFKFRIPGPEKVRILKELYSIGYTARRLVRGDAGMKADSSLCKILGTHPLE